MYPTKTECLLRLDILKDQKEILLKEKEKINKILIDIDLENIILTNIVVFINEGYNEGNNNCSQ